MIRRHPVLGIVAGVYLAGLAILCLAPNDVVRDLARAVRRSAPWTTISGVEFVINVVLFVPVGLLLLLVLGRRRWLGVLMFGVIASCWLELAELVWMPNEGGATRSIMAHIIGTTLGVGLLLVILAMPRPQRRALSTESANTSRS